MKGVKRVEVAEEYTIGKSFILYVFYIEGQRYAVSKKLVDNGKTWRREKDETVL